MEVRSAVSQRLVSSNPDTTVALARSVPPSPPQAQRPSFVDGPPPVLWQLTADFLDWQSIRALMHTQRNTRQGMLDAPPSEWRRAARNYLPGQASTPFPEQYAAWRACLRYDLALQNMAAGLPLRTLRDTFEGTITRSAWSPDGAYLAVAGGHDVRVWHVTRGLVLTTTHTGDIYALTWSPDGRFCASGGMDGVLCVLDMEGGPEFRLPSQGGRLYGACWSPDSTRVVSPNSGINACIVDVIGRTSVDIPHGDAVAQVSWSPDGGLLTTACANGMARLCDGYSGAVLAAHHHRQGFFRSRDNLVDTKWSPDGKLAVNLGSQGSLSFFTPAGDVRVYEMGDYYHGLTWSPDGQQLLLQGERGILSAILPWPSGDTRTKEREGAQHFEALRRTEIRDQTHARWSRDGQYLVCLQAHSLRVLDGPGAHEIVVDELRTLPTFWDFSADGRYVGIGLFEGGLRVWDLQTRCVRVMQTGAVRCAAWSPDGAWVAVGSWDGNLYLVDANALGDTPRAAIATGGSPSDVRWSSDGTALRFTLGTSESVVLCFAPE